MSNKIMQFALQFDDTETFIAETGHKRTIIVEGPMGWGKSSLLPALGKRPEFANHTRVYIDCTTKTDSGDFFMIKYSADGETFRTVPHEELGLHLDGPVILMFDEIGKMPRSAFNSVLRVLYERKGPGNSKLHDDSIIFSTTNLAVEGLGDLLLPHGRNRVTVVTMRNPDQHRWLGWSISAGVHPLVQSWAKDTPELFTSFTDFASAEECATRTQGMIYDPRAVNKPVAFVTGRSMEGASDIFHCRDAALAAGRAFSDKILHAGLVGTVGPAAAGNLMAYISMLNDLPSKDEIANDPLNARIPVNGTAVCMLVYRVLATIERAWAPQWMTYLRRLDTVAQGLFGNGTRVKGYPRLNAIVHCKEYQEWATINAHLFK